MSIALLAQRFNTAPINIQSIIHPILEAFDCTLTHFDSYKSLPKTIMYYFHGLLEYLRNLCFLKKKIMKHYIYVTRITCNLKSTTPLCLHLHISSDGGNPFQKKNASIWPFSAVLLYLPNYLYFNVNSWIVFEPWLEEKFFVDCILK
jgi:hypothetical protein